MNCGVNMLRLWMRGKAAPTVKKLPAICETFHVSADWLLGTEDCGKLPFED